MDSGSALRGEGRCQIGVMYIKEKKIKMPSVITRVVTE